MDPVRVLLTGSAGFIGAAIHRALEAGGHDVVPVDVMLPAAHGTAPPPPGTHQRDIRLALADPCVWPDLLGGVDAVCHQAAVVGAGTSTADLPDFAAHNDLGTAALLAAMDRAGVRRLVLASSMVVYGEGRYACAEHGGRRPGPRARADLDAGRFDNRCDVCGGALSWLPVTEDARLDPRSSYAASKVAQEHYAAAWARQAGGSVVALRYHNVYGPGMPRDTPYAGVAALFRSSLEHGRAPRVYEDGGQTRDFVHVDDVAAANLAALRAVADAPAEQVRAHNVASGHPVTIRRVAELLGRAAGIAPEVTGGYRLGDVRHIVASADRARAELGFTAAIDPEQGIPAFADAPLRA